MGEDLHQQLTYLLYTTLFLFLNVSFYTSLLSAPQGFVLEMQGGGLCKCEPPMELSDAHAHTDTHSAPRGDVVLQYKVNKISKMFTVYSSRVQGQTDTTMRRGRRRKESPLSLFPC